ncbi:hypothetical protein MMC14_005569 [Varicellaria rhodocarpa]|nr:hypothetical protein [Varicellaria rhodocarpa]
MNNSRSEPHPIYELLNSVFKVPSNIDPQTPSKISSPNAHHSPSCTVTESADSPSTPSKPSNALLSPHSTVPTESTTDPEDYYDWPSSDGDAITKVADKISMPPPTEMPRKVPMIFALAIFGKCSYD